MSRIENLDYDTLSPEQKKIADEIIESRGQIAGPFIPWLRSPELADRSQRLGAYCRFETSLPPRLSELAILVVAREWTVHVEWNAHKPLALEAGLAPAVPDAIAERRPPDFENRDEEAVYAFSTELLRTKTVEEATYSAAIDALGEAGVVDLVAILGYYTNVAMVIKSFDMLPADGALPLAD